MLSEKIKSLRKQAKLSQEQLAEKLNVSRQAVTKWETDAGVPDIANLQAIASLFHISLDELLENQAKSPASQDFLFDSVTEYDIDGKKNFDITLAGARRVWLTGTEEEKIKVRLASDQIADIQSTYKVKIDDLKNRIDVDVRRFGTMTEAKSKEALYIFIRIPKRYVKRVELSGSAEELKLQEIQIENLEFTGKTHYVSLENVSGHVELNSNEDMDIRCLNLDGRLDINQISATSRLTLPAGTDFQAVTKGIANHIFCEKDGKDGKPIEALCKPGEEKKETENIIELNGIKSELVICLVSDKGMRDNLCRDEAESV